VQWSDSFAYDHLQTKTLEHLRPDSSTRVLLIVPIFLPQLLAQLGIGFLLRGLAQLARNDVVVAAVRNVGRHRVRAAAAARAAADSTAPTLPAIALALTFPLTFALALTLTARATATAGRAALAAVAITIPAGTATAGRSGILTTGVVTAAGSTAAATLTRDHRLLIADASIEDAERRIELAIDLRGALAGGHSTAAATSVGHATRRSAARGTATRSTATWGATA
jgi:hypothetical protein